MMQVGDTVTTPRGVSAVVMEMATGNGDNGPVGVAMCLTKDVGASGNNGLAWYKQEDLTVEE